MAALTIGAGIAGAAGSLYGGMANSAMYSYQAGIANLNKQIASQNANYEYAIGETQAQQQGMKTRAQIGQTRATQGASGLDVNTGTDVMVRSSEAELGAEDQAMVRNSAAYRAYGFTVQGVEDQAQANADTMAAGYAQTSGAIGAFSSVLSAGGSFASQWLTGSTKGMTGSQIMMGPFSNWMNS